MSEDKKHLKTDSHDNWLNVGSVVKSCSSCFVSRTGDLFEMNFSAQKRAAESESRREMSRSFRGIRPDERKESDEASRRAGVPESQYECSIVL